MRVLFSIASAIVLASSGLAQDPLPSTEIRGGISATEADILYYDLSHYVLRVTSEPSAFIDEKLIATHGEILETPLAELNAYGLEFAYWEENGQPFLSESGLPLRKVSLEMLQDRNLVAVYLPGHLDEDMDGLEDWREWRYFGTRDYGAEDDPDGDGYSIDEERNRSLSIILPDQISTGGISATESSLQYYSSDYRFLKMVSDPPNIIDDRYYVLAGETQQTPLAELNSNGLEFAYWAEDGIPFLSEAGTPLRQITLEMNDHRNLVATYLTGHADEDADGLEDWLEWRYFGTKDIEYASDPDQDGFSIGQERDLGLSLRLFDQHATGGISATESIGSQFYLPFTEQPSDLSGNIGGGGSLVANTPIPDATYQWYRANSDFTETELIEGANSSSLDITFIEGSSWYWVEVSIPDGSRSSRPVNVYGYGGFDPDSILIRLLESTSTYDRIELSVLDDSIEEGRSYAIFASKDLTYWMRLDEDVQVFDKEAIADLKIAPVDAPMFFKIEEYIYHELSPNEVSQQAERLNSALDSYSSALKTDLLAHPLFSEEDSDLIDTLVSYIKHLSESMEPEEKKLFIESLYNSGFMNKMENVSPSNLPPPPEPQNSGGFRKLSYTPSEFTNEFAERWDWVRAARSWHVHAEGMKLSAAIESANGVLAGSTAILGKTALGVLAELGTITFNATPSCPTKIYAFTEARTDNLSPGNEPYPFIEFYADFESKSSLEAELVTLGVSKLTNYLIGLYYDTKTADSDLQKIDDYLEEIMNKSLSSTAQDSFSTLSEGLTEFLLKYTGKEVWNAVPFDPDYWAHYFTWENLADNPGSGRPPATYDFLNQEIEPVRPGSGKIVFRLNDTLCNVQLETEIPVSVINQAPVLGEPGPQYLSHENRAISMDFQIEDDWPQDLSVQVSAPHGHMFYENNMLSYWPKALSLNQVTININSDETNFGYATASLSGGTDDQIQVIVSDGANDPVELNIPIDLTPLLDSIQISLGAPEQGMLSRFEFWNPPVIDAAAGTITRDIAAKSELGYSGEGGSVQYYARLGPVSAESSILLFHTPEEIIVIAGPDISTNDDDGDGTESVALSGQATLQDGATITSWQWSWEGGSANGQFAEATFPVGDTIVRLTVRDSLGNEAYDSLVVSIVPNTVQLVARAGANMEVQDSDNNGREWITLDGSTSSGNIVSWEWEWPSGSASGQSAHVEFPIGEQVVTLTVTDDQGTSSSDTIIVNVPHGCAPDTRPNLMPLTLPLREIYGDLQMGVSATTFFIGDATGLWTYTQGTNCNPGILIFTYDDSGNDQNVYYEKITLLGGYSGTYVFQIYQNGQLTHSEFGEYR